jgi:phage-related protein
MATFPSIDISYGAEKRSRPKTRTVKFGDGYEHRTVFGLPTHANPVEWNVTWNNISEADSDTIEAFLNARAADSASFDWTPPDEATSYKWVCSEWSKTIDYPTLATINATFRQVFEP